MLAPWWTLRTGTVPFWMTFNMESSLPDIKQYLDAREPFDAIHTALFQHGVEGVGAPTLDQWREVIARARRNGRYVGKDIDTYPYEMSIYARYDKAMREISARYPVPGYLTLDEFDDFLAEAGDYEGMRWEQVLVRR